MFTNFETAHKFMRRNLSRTIVSGLINLIDKEIKNMEERGWEIEFMNWPRKFTDHIEYKIDFEIIEIAGMGYKTYHTIKDYHEE